MEERACDAERYRDLEAAMRADAEEEGTRCFHGYRRYCRSLSVVVGCMFIWRVRVRVVWCGGLGLYPRRYPMDGSIDRSMDGLIRPPTRTFTRRQPNAPARPPPPVGNTARWGTATVAVMGRRAAAVVGLVLVREGGRRSRRSSPPSRCRRGWRRCVSKVFVCVGFVAAFVYHVQVHHADGPQVYIYTYIHRNTHSRRRRSSTG